MQTFKFLKSGLALLIGLVIIYFAFTLYDKFLGFDDGLIRGVFFKRIILLGGLISVIFWLCIQGARSARRSLQNLSLFTFSFFFCLLLIELVAWIAFSSGVVKGEAPKHHLLSEPTGLILNQRPFWGDYNPYFAKWYLPNDTLKRVNCEGDSLFLFTNSLGARDKERQEESDEKRVVLLGDSFIEGYMVNVESRMSNLLEVETGIEHLNFGINGTSPINYFLKYKHLGQKFDHDVVVVGLLPANDFEDFSSGDRGNLIKVPLYRPYWDGNYPDYELRYSLSSIDHSIYSLRHFDSPEKISAVIDSVFWKLPLRKKIKVFVQDNSYTNGLVSWAREKVRPAPPAGFTRFNAYSQEEWNVFSYSLERLFEKASEKKVVLLLLPVLSDIEAYELTGENRLAEELGALIEDHPNVSIIDLLPELHLHPNPEELYVPCDGHWSKEGERLVSEILFEHPVYQSALSDELWD